MSAVSDLRPDAQAVLLLVLLYTLQGVPMGLGAAVSFMLQERGADYSQQAIFSLVSWPFSLKLLWAPVVDTVCLPAAGLRRSWIVPLQTIIGIAMFATADYSQNLLHGGVEQAVKPMTALYFVMHFLCATQDVAVDGWALTMLSAKNVGYAGTINAVGQTIGYFAAFTGFLALEQAKLMSLGSFMLLCGALFLVSAAWVAVSPESRQVADKEDPEAARKRAAAAAAAPLAALASSYKEMLSIARLPPVRTLALFLILNRIGFAATDSLTALEMMKRGVSKTTLATISACITPISIVMPVVVGPWTARSPWRAWRWAYIPRMIMSLAAVFLIYALPARDADDHEPTHLTLTYYVAIMILLGLFSALSTVQFVAQMSFFSTVSSDAEIGGTYMTMLNTMSNLGSKWTTSAALYLAGSDVVRRLAVPQPPSWMSAPLDPFYTVNWACFVLGIVAMPVIFSIARRIESTPMPMWQVKGASDKE